MNAILQQLLALKPGEVAEVVKAGAGALAKMLERAGEPAPPGLAEVVAYADAAQRVLGGYDWDELAKAGPLYAGGSGKERLEADLLLEARQGAAADFWPAPTGTKPTGGPPPAQGGQED